MKLYDVLRLEVGSNGYWKCLFTKYGDVHFGDYRIAQAVTFGIRPSHSYKLGFYEVLEIDSLIPSGV